MMTKLAHKPMVENGAATRTTKVPPPAAAGGGRRGGGRPPFRTTPIDPAAILRPVRLILPPAGGTAIIGDARAEAIAVEGGQCFYRITRK